MMHSSVQERRLDSKPEIDILLATWNGARFLEQQLDSLSRQSFQNFRLLVRDDASGDSTMQVLERFRASESHRVVIRRNSSRQGACRTFSLLATECDAPYFAFCDQDDIWRPDKLQVQLAEAKRIEAEHGSHTPVLIFSDMELVGADDQILTRSLWKMKHMNPHRATFGAMMVQNLVNGCTVLGNRSLLLQGLPIPDEAFMHDFWLGLVAAAFGVLVAIDETTVGYRQHEHNTMGAGNQIELLDAVRRLFGDPAFTQGLAKSRRQARKFAEVYVDRLSQQQMDILRTWSNSNDLPPVLRHWALYKSGLRRTRFLNNLGFLARV